jgi:RNase P subunit RPR2
MRKILILNNKIGVYVTCDICGFQMDWYPQGGSYITKDGKHIIMCLSCTTEYDLNELNKMNNENRGGMADARS